MIRPSRLLPLLLALLLALLSAMPAYAASPAGLYRADEGPEVAAQLLLREDGSYAYALAYGALDETSQGRWTTKGDTVTLTTDPKPKPAEFVAATPASTDQGSADTPPAYLTVTLPNGRGLAGIDFTITCVDGIQITGYTQSDGWSRGAEWCGSPQWIQLLEPIHEIESQPLPIAPDATALHFVLVPNDIGRIDLTGATAVIEGDRLTLSRDRGSIRFVRVKR